MRLGNCIFQSIATELAEETVTLGGFASKTCLHKILRIPVACFWEQGDSKLEETGWTALLTFTMVTPHRVISAALCGHVPGML